MRSFFLWNAPRPTPPPAEQAAADPLPPAYHVEHGDVLSLSAQLRISRLEELVALRRRALAWSQYGRPCQTTLARIHALEQTLGEELA